MKKMHRIMTLMMALALVLTMGLAGCQKNEPAQPSTTTATAPPLEPVTLNYWIFGPGKQKDSDKVWTEFNRLVQEHLPNTTVNFTVFGSEYVEQWAKAMAAQEPIDIAWTGWSHNIQDEANKGSIQPLNKLLDQYGEDIKASLGETFLNLHKMKDGEIYQIPNWQGAVGGRFAFMFPKEVAALAGPTYVADLQKVFEDNFAIPTAEAKAKVFDKIEEYLAAAKAGGKLAKGYDVGSLGGWYLWRGGNYDIGGHAYIEQEDSTFTVKSLYASEIQRMNYKYMADWFTKGYIRSDIASVESISNTWAKDKTWENSYILRAHNGFTDNVAELESKAIGFESVAAFTNPTLSYISGSATGTSIPKTCRNPERAMMLINLLFADKGTEAYRTFAYGLKDQHWTDNGNGTITTLGGSGAPTSDWSYGNNKWVMGTCMNSLVTQADTKGYYEELKEKEKTAWVSPFLSFTLDNTKLQTETALMQTVVKEYDEMLRRGYVGNNWEAKYNEFVEKLKAAGMDAYLAEAQRQVNQYVQEKGIKK